LPLRAGATGFPLLGLSAKSYRGTISSFSAGMVWIAFLSSLKCEETISGGSRRIIAFVLMHGEFH
jgi:hypothetical protein